MVLTAGPVPLFYGRCPTGSVGVATDLIRRAGFSPSSFARGPNERDGKA